MSARRRAFWYAAGRGMKGQAVIVSAGTIAGMRWLRANVRQFSSGRTERPMSNSDEGTTRRAVVGGVSATLAAAVGTSALAQQGQSGGAHSATTAGAGTGQSGSAQPLVD